MKSETIKSPEQKEYAWKAKRHGKITSSTLPDLMKAGKGTPYGKAFFDALDLVRYERRTGITREMVHVRRSIGDMKMKLWRWSG